MDRIYKNRSALKLCVSLPNLKLIFEEGELEEISLDNDKYVETVVLLSHKKPDSTISVKVERKGSSIY